MAVRPLAFAVRLRDKGRTLHVRNDARDPRVYVLEDVRAGEAGDETRVRLHRDLPAAIRDAAATWRKRLH